MSLLRAAAERGEFLLTAELGPPKGTDTTKFREKTRALKEAFHGLNVTDNQSAVVRLSPVVASIVVLEEGGEPILQLTCRDRNRMALQSELLGASACGVDNVLVVSGDHPRFGDHPEAKAVYDLDSVQLLEVIRGLNGGIDMVGKTLNAPTTFFAGGAVAPAADPLEPELMKFHKKIAAGAEFFQTQAVFSPEKFALFKEHVKDLDVPIVAGVLILKSVRMVEFINERVPGLDIPSDIERAIRAADDPEDEGVRVAARLLEALREIADGAHLMAIGNEERVLDVLSSEGRA